MYYSAVPPSGSPAGIAQEKQQSAAANIYVQAPSPFGHAATAGYASAHSGLPPGLAAATSGGRYPATPQAYAVVSSAGHPGFGHPPPHPPGAAIQSPTAAYATSLPYAGYATIPTSTPTYITTGGQFHPHTAAAVGYHPHQTAAALAARNGPPSHYPAPVQAGAPLIAAGYSHMPGSAGLPPPHPQQAVSRSYPFGGLAAYPAAAFSVPGGTATTPVGPYHTPSPYVPPF